MTIWVNEQIDSCGILYSCIASCNEEAARDCHQTWQEKLTDNQKQEGWVSRLRTVSSWDEVPVNALKISF